MSRSTRVGGWIYSALILAFLFLPLAFIVAFSFNNYPFFTFPYQGITLRWYTQLFQSGGFLATAVLASARVALVASAGATVLGTTAAFGLVRRRYFWRPLLLVGGLAPLVVPALIVGIGLQLFISYLHLSFGYWTVAIGHTLLTTPFVLLIVSARLLTFDVALQSAARDLGASWWQAFRWVVLPIIKWALIGSAVFAFLISFNEFTIALFTSGTEQTLPLVVWSMLKQGIPPTLLSFTTLVIATAALGCLLLVRAFTEILGRTRTSHEN